jgi:hypothetical protein
MLGFLVGDLDMAHEIGTLKRWQCAERRIGVVWCERGIRHGDDAGSGDIRGLFAIHSVSPG